MDQNEQFGTQDTTIREKNKKIKTKNKQTNKKLGHDQFREDVSERVRSLLFKKSKCFIHVCKKISKEISYQLYF